MLVYRTSRACSTAWLHHQTQQVMRPCMKRSKPASQVLSQLALALPCAFMAPLRCLRRSLRLPQCGSCQESHQHQKANGGEEAATAHDAGQTGHGHLGGMGQARHGEEGSQEVQGACTGARSNMCCRGRATVAV